MGFKTSVVAIADIPEPPTRLGQRSPMADVYETLAGLKRGQALKIEFESPQKALSARAALRKVAQKQGEFISSSKADGGATRFFWLEPKT